MRKNLTSSKQDKINQELLDAAEKGDYVICQALVEKGANPNIRDASKRTALHWAAEYNHTAMCLKLLETTEDVNLQDFSDSTALHFAAKDGNMEVVEALIKQGANPNITDDSTRTALHYAAEYNHTAMCLKLLETTEDVNLQDFSDSIALHFVAKYGNMEVVKALIKQGANPNITDNSARTSLHWAAEYNHTDVCLKLLETIEDVNLQDCYNKTALRYAVENNNTYLAVSLISEGARPLDASSNPTLAHVQTAASHIYQAKLAKEKSLIEEIRQQVNEHLTDKLPVTLEGDSLSNIFAAIKKEIKGGYCDVDKIEKLYKILVPHLQNIASNDRITTGKFKHFFRKNLQDFTEWSINLRMSYMIGSHLDNFQEGNAKLESAIPGAVMSHVSSFLPISDLTSLGEVSPRAGYQKTTGELQDYQAYLSQKYKDKEIIVRDKFFNEVVLPLAKRQNLPELEPRQETDPSITPAIPKEQSRSQTIENEQAEVEDVVSSMVQAVVDRSNVEISSHLEG